MVHSVFDKALLAEILASFEHLRAKHIVNCHNIAYWLVAKAHLVEQAVTGHAVNALWDVPALGWDLSSSASGLTMTISASFNARTAVTDNVVDLCFVADYLDGLTIESSDKNRTSCINVTITLDLTCWPTLLRTHLGLALYNSIVNVGLHEKLKNKNLATAKLLLRTFYPKTSFDSMKQAAVLDMVDESGYVFADWFGPQPDNANVYVSMPHDLM